MHTPRRALNSILRHSRWVPAAMAAVAVGTVGFASGAGAAPVSVLPKAAALPPSAGASTYLAGYQVTPSGGLASASVTFTVPSITCTGNDKKTGAKMFDGVYTDSLATYAFVASFCTTTGPAVEFLLTTPAGGGPETGVSPGDTVVASMFQSSSSTWAEVHDLTSGFYWFSEDGINGGDTVIDIGSLNQFSIGGGPVPTFTKVKFSNATVNGDDLGFGSVGATQFNDLNGGDLLIKSGVLTTTGAGTSFADTFKHAS
jgi:hypothetical protein